jgi:cell division protein ZapA (FtsZ GTPase activity inhibitor)
MESSGAERQSVRVSILGKPYTLLATGDPREVEEVASAVDELMHSIREKAPTADPTRIAVLACMHFADQLRIARKEVEELRLRKDSHSEEYAAMLDRLIASVEELAV